MSAPTLVMPRAREDLQKYKDMWGMTSIRDTYSLDAIPHGPQYSNCFRKFGSFSSPQRTTQRASETLGMGT
jgi:hypothetical protein